MKKSIMSILICMLTLMVSFSAEAQTNQAPNNFKLFNSWRIPVGGYADSTSVSYFNSRTDTLYAKDWRQGGSAEFIKVGGARLVSLTVETTDTVRLLVTIKKRTASRNSDVAASAWTTISAASDSLSNFGASAASGTVLEIPIRDYDASLFDNVDQELMIILTHYADRNDTQRTAKRRARLNWAQ